MLGWLLPWLYFYINSCCSIKSMQVFKDIFPICSCSIILYRYDALYIHSINLNWIKSSSIVYSSCPNFSNLQYMHFIDGVDILWLVRQFLVSSTWNLFFLPQPTFSWVSYFFLWSDLFFQKLGLPGLWYMPWWRLSLSPHIQL